MKQKQSIKNRLVFSVFGSVFVFAAFLLIYYENELHQLSINKSSQIVDLVGSRYHQNISNFLRGCHQHFENIKFESKMLTDTSISKQLDEFLTQTKCFQESGIYFKDSGKWITTEESTISKIQINNLIKNSQFSYWWKSTKSYLVTRDIDMEGNAKLIFIMDFGFLRRQLTEYQNVLKSYGFNESAVFIKSPKTFQGFGIKEPYYNKLQARNSEVNFEFEGGDFISMKSIPFPKEIGPGFLCSIIPHYDVFRPIFSTGFILLILSILLVVYVVQRTINPLKQAIIQIEKSTQVIGQVSDQNLNVGQELSQMVHQQSDVIRQLSNQVEVSINLGSSNSQQLNESKDVLINTMHSIQSSFSSVGNMNSKLSMLQNLADEIKTEVDSLCEISNRIDVVAINASIEAARAGVRGREFAVVADEIAKLSTSSLGRSSNIEEYLNSLIKILEETFYSSNKSQNLLSVSIQRVDEASEILELIASQTNQQIIQLNTLIKVLISSDRQTLKNQQLAKHCAELGVLLNRSIEDLRQVSQLITTLVRK